MEGKIIVLIMHFYICPPSIRGANSHLYPSPKFATALIIIMIVISLFSFAVNRCDGPRPDRRERRQRRGLRDIGLGPDHRPVRGGGPVLRRGEDLQSGRGQTHPLARRIGRSPARRAALRIPGQRPCLRLER